MDCRFLKFDRQTLSLAQIDFYLFCSNDLNYTSKSFNKFLMDSLSYIQNYKITHHIKLENFLDGKMSKIIPKLFSIIDMSQKSELITYIAQKIILYYGLSIDYLL